MVNSGCVQGRLRSVFNNLDVSIYGPSVLHPNSVGAFGRLSPLALLARGDHGESGRDEDGEGAGAETGGGAALERAANQFHRFLDCINVGLVCSVIAIAFGGLASSHLVHGFAQLGFVSDSHCIHWVFLDAFGSRLHIGLSAFLTICQSTQWHPKFRHA
jgi:hypothetical protein